MFFIITISNRLSKLIGNITKILSYPFHLFFPHKRFIIPEHSNPYFPSKRIDKIPKIIWQTNYTNKVSLPMYLNYLFNRLLSLSYEYRYVSTETRQSYIEENMSDEIVSAFNMLTDGAAQADLWRLLVLYHEGGTYIDIDAHLVWPLSKIIQTNDNEIFLLNKQHYTNYFISSAPKNSILEEAVNKIIKNIESRNIEGGVYNLTGPNALNTALEGKIFNERYYRYTCVQGSFTNEYFQYIDKPRGKWIHKQNSELLKKQNTKDKQS
ncbi:hypothetical protein JHD50_12345 [Sulfurimonas sp. MAG313]|nr:glycosyltransferase [Sulfurimonas sp. MAG313]MDF1882078.1 hypothetical protein [Sulfurimonas sp. MAG313]